MMEFRRSVICKIIYTVNGSEMNMKKKFYEGEIKRWTTACEYVVD